MRKKELKLCLLLVTLTFLFNGCKKRQEYFVITERNYESKDKSKNGEITKGLVKFNPPRNWYTDFVVILDSTDRVYIYQTETIKKDDSPSSHYKLNNYRETSSDTTQYSNYIGLMPEHLICFKSKDFIGFIKDNWDIFNLDTTKNDTTTRLITIATNQDVIKNTAFYDLQELSSMFIKGPKSAEFLIPIEINRNSHNSICVVRKTTEEENAVIYCKRRNLKYKAETIKWSKNFINGKYKPFSKEYNSEEKKLDTKQKAIFSIKKLSRELRHIS